MKRIIVTLVLIAAQTALAAPTTANTETSAGSVTTTAADVQSTAKPATPTWRFAVGTSQYDGTGNIKSEGTGLNAAVERNVLGYFSAGASYSSYSINETNLGLYGVHLNFTPIAYSYKKTDLWASATVGGIFTDGVNFEQENYHYVGASVEARYDRTIGIRADQKLSSEFDGITTVSLVGYY